MKTTIRHKGQPHEVSFKLPRSSHGAIATFGLKILVANAYSAAIHARGHEDWTWDQVDAYARKDLDMWSIKS